MPARPSEAEGSQSIAKLLKEDPFASSILKDEAFVNAFHQQNLVVAALAASTVARDILAAHQQRLEGASATHAAAALDGLVHPSHSRFRLPDSNDAECRTRLMAGSAVRIVSQPPALIASVVGCEGTVTRMDAGGTVFVRIKQTGSTEEMNPAHLALIPPPGMQAPPLLRSASDIGPRGSHPSDSAYSPLLGAGSLPPDDNGHGRDGRRPPMLVGRAVTKMKETTRRVRRELLMLEEGIPWTAVDRGWRNTRNGWRRSVRSCETFQECARLIRTLWRALIPDNCHVSLDLSTELLHGLEQCVSGEGHYQSLGPCWEEFRTKVGLWLRARGEPSTLPSEQCVSQAARAIHALETAAALGPGQGPIKQVPLESILNFNSANLSVVRHALEAERATLAEKLATLSHTLKAARGAETAAAPSAVAGELLTVGASYGGLPRLSVDGFGYQGTQMSVDTDEDVGVEATDMDSDTD